MKPTVPNGEPPKKVLIVDDEESMRELLSIMLRKEGFDIVVAESRKRAAEELARGALDLVITDVKLPDGDGIEILRHVKAASPETMVIVMTAYGSTESAVAAMKLGAHDYLIKPFDVDELRIVVRNALQLRRLQAENQLLRAEFQTQHGLDRIIGTSEAMQAVFRLVRAVAVTPSTALITGESGTGKELVAKAIHTLSPRNAAPFVSVNCGALPESLLESELFGHMKGAFTDAHQNKKGLFEAAHRGTLFLDEIGEMPHPMQVKLLRALQERRIRRVGGTEEIDVDVRLLAATNSPLEERVRARTFREDLFYRLNVIPIHLPALRDRLADVPLLAEHFLKRYSRDLGRPLQLAPETVRALMAHRWPGNVRELENAIERAATLETGPVIGVEHLPVPLLETTAAEEPIAAGFRLRDHIRAVERRLVREALQRTAGNRVDACRLLGVTPRTLRYLLRKYPVAPGQ
jgi:two-component system response regulator PilR (NtrC family)